jgi:methyl-accepting chemotaxis protein
MLDEALQEEATLYASGAMSAPERTRFELILEFHDELREFVHGLHVVAAGASIALAHGEAPTLSPTLRDRILAQAAARAQSRREGFVMTTPDGLVQWVNRQFVEMCGYSFEELEGRKLGPILQGALTEPESAARLREAVRRHRPCVEEILNYRKNGEPYWVRIEMIPVGDHHGKIHWLVAREREVRERKLPTGAA